MRKLYIVFSFCLFFISCENNTKTDDLIKALGGTYKVITLPNSISEESEIYIGLRHSDGRIKSYAGFGGLKGGEKVRVFVFKPLDKKLGEYSFIYGQGSSGRGKLNLKDIKTASPNLKNNLNLNDWIYRFSVDNKIISSKLPRNDDFDLILYTDMDNKTLEPTP